MGDNLNGIFANMIQGMGFIGCAPNRVYNMAPPDGGGVEATAEGTELTLHSAAAPLTALTLYGKSEQETTTGAQLNNGNMSNLIGSTTGVIVSSLYSVSIIIPIQGEEDYTISYKNGEKAITFHCTTEEYPAEGVEIVDVFTGSSGIQVPEKTMHTSSRAKYLVINVSSDESELIKNAMLNLGTTALPWEPYTGGQPSPSPDYPQEIKSAGDSGTVNVTLSDGGSQSQTLPVQTPNGLPGVPVSSGGNYTDANGQQWICDKVDFKRGVYVQRVGKYIPTGNESISGPYTRDRVDQYVIAVETGVAQNSINFGLSNKFKCENRCAVNTFTVTGQFIYFRFAEGTQTPESAREILNGCEFWYILATSIESPLSASELSAYAALRTYSPTTVVSNDAGAWMRVGYKAIPQPMTMLARKR